MGVAPGLYLWLVPMCRAKIGKKTGTQESGPAESTVFNADFSGQRSGIANIILRHHFA